MILKEPAVLKASCYITRYQVVTITISGATNPFVLQYVKIKLISSSDYLFFRLIIVLCVAISFLPSKVVTAWEKSCANIWVRLQAVDICMRQRFRLSAT